MPSGQPSLILTHHASAINYAITAQFAGNRRVPLSGRVVFMLYLRKSQGFYFISAPSSPSFFTLTRCVRSPASPPFSHSLPLTLLSSSWQLFPHISCHFLSLCLPSDMFSLSLCWVLAVSCFQGFCVWNPNKVKHRSFQTKQLYTEVPLKLRAAS